MKLWKPSTARISQKIPLISAHRSARRRAPRAAADSSIAAPAGASSVSNANSSAIYSSLLRDRFDDHEGLRPGVVVGQRHMDMRDVAFGGQRVKSRLGSAGERERRRARRRVDHADVFQEQDRKSTRLYSSH